MTRASHGLVEIRFRHLDTTVEYEVGDDFDWWFLDPQPAADDRCRSGRYRGPGPEFKAAMLRREADKIEGR